MAFACFVTVLAFLKNSSADGTPRIGNKLMLTVVSDSMEGPNGFYIGDLIFSDSITSEEALNLKVGDVITFPTNMIVEGSVVYNTHRIVEIKEDTVHPGKLLFITQGDNTLGPDGYEVSSDNVIGVWTGKRVAGFGKFISFLQSSTGFLCCIVLPMAALFIYELVVLLKNVNAVRYKDKKVITAEDEELIRQKAIEEFLAKQAQAQAQQNSDAAATENKDDKNA
ncbi:MAG: signal peptidase I [Clostridia bacterium]|nr:signal peptidase I [Clostridia bacterium]